jgi:hypothetical protein
MRRVALLGFLGALAFAEGAAAQSQAATQPPPPSHQISAPAEQRPDTGNPENRGTRTQDQSAPAQNAAKQKAYKGKTGAKRDPGTACSTARPTPNGGVDCGTGGKGAKPEKVPK